MSFWTGFWIHTTSIRFDLDAIGVQSGGNLVSAWFACGVDLVTVRFKCAIDLASMRCQSGVGMRSLWDQNPTFENYQDDQDRPARTKLDRDREARALHRSQNSNSANRQMLKQISSTSRALLEHCSSPARALLEHYSSNPRALLRQLP